MGTITPGNSLLGIGDPTSTLGGYIYGDGHGIIYYPTDGGIHDITGSTPGIASGVNAVLGFAIDIGAQTISVYVNNVLSGTRAFSGATSMSRMLTATLRLYGLVNLYVTANFGATALTYAPPAGYNAGLYVEGNVYSYLNPLDKGSNITLSSEYLIASCVSAYQGYVRAVQGKKRGKWYWETTYGPTAAIGAGGCAPSSGNKADDYLGSQSGIRYDSSGACYMNSAVQFNGAAVASNGVVGFAADLDARTLKVYVGGVLQGTVSGVPLSTTTWMPAIGNQGVGAGVTGTYNPGPTFAQPVPSGYNAGWYEPHIFTTLDAGKKASGTTLSNGNLTSATTAEGQVRAVVGKTAGKWYWEATVNTTGFASVGIASTATGLTRWCGYNAKEWGWRLDSGEVYNNSGAVLSGIPYATSGSVLGFALDLDAGTIAFYLNNTLYGTATGIPLNDTYFPTSSAATSGATNITMNFGTGQTKYAPPAGFEEGFWG